MPNPIKNNGKTAAEALSKFLGNMGAAGAAAGKGANEVGNSGKEAAEEQIQAMRNAGGETGAKNPPNKEDGPKPTLPGGSLQNGIS